jgi:hypothetical protein
MTTTDLIARLRLMSSGLEQQAADALETLQRERDEAVAKLNAEPKHWNPVYNTDPVQRACGELPEGFEIEIGLERDAGWVGLCGPDGAMIEFDDDADHFDWKIHAAIDAAIKSVSEG